MAPLVSVLIPSYNYGRFIKEAINSVLQQTFKDYEIIVVDDGSTDNTKAVVAEFPTVRYIYQENGGIAKARNTAVRAARGKWIAFVDADDLWKKDKLEKQVEYIRKHPDCRIVYVRYKNFTNIPTEDLNARQKELLNIHIDCYLAGALIDARLFAEYGLFDESKTYGEDTEWVFRLKFFKVNMEACLKEELYLRRVHMNNITSSHGEQPLLEVCKIGAEALRRVRRLQRK